MKRIVTQPQTLRFRYFFGAILFCTLMLNATQFKTKTFYINTNTESETTFLNYVAKNINDVVNNREVKSEKILRNDITISPITAINSKFTKVSRVLSVKSALSKLFVFTGTGNWVEPNRWSLNEVPGNVAGDSVVIDGICTIDNLTINVGAKITINAAKILNVTGTLTNYAGTEGLLIKSDPLLPNGSLVYASGTPLATVEMYSKASWDLIQADGSKYSWQFFGIPFKTLLFTDYFTYGFVRQYNESSTNNDNLWTNQNDASTLTSGIGYEIVQQKPKTYEFMGELTNDDFVQSLEYTPGAGYPGQNMFGNPYTAAINIKKIVFGSNTDNSVYLYNTGTYNQWLDNSDNPYNENTSAPGQFTVVPIGLAGLLGVPAQIPSMQGFLVNASSSGGSLSIPYSSVSKNAERQRAPGVNTTASTDKAGIRIDLFGRHYADRMWIFSDPTFTAKYDNGWDGFKMLGSMQTPQLYAMETDGNFQIDAVADMNGTCLGFNAGQDTNFKLTFTTQNIKTIYSALYLVDILANKTVDITASGSEYEFTAASTPTPEKRFKIVTSPKVDTNIPQVSSLVKVFNSNGIIFIQNLSDHIGELTLYTMNGVAVKKVLYKANDITTFSTSNLLQGPYVAKACTNNQMVTEKLIIR